jgi:hypothetical protein
MTTELVLKYQSEIARLDSEIAHYERQWRKVPRFAWAALLCPIAGVLAGWGAAFVALLVSAALVGTRAYLVAMRKSENMWTRDRLRADIEAAGACAPASHTETPASDRRSTTLPG